VRIRLNGVLTELVHLPLELMEKISGRFKVLANLVTYQTGLPQEGHAPADPELGGVEQRISIFPTTRGEKIVVRIFDPSNRSFDLATLGFEEDILSEFVKLVCKPNGLILLTGPTGSGKTTAIYSALVHAGAEARALHQHRHGGRPGGIQPADDRAGPGQPGAGIYYPGPCARSCARTRRSSWWAKSATRKRPTSPCRRG
jgi:hypothetical protein